MLTVYLLVFWGFLFLNLNTNPNISLKNNQPKKTESHFCLVISSCLILDMHMYSGRPNTRLETFFYMITLSLNVTETQKEEGGGWGVGGKNSSIH